jgi:hypothetical protein
MRVIFILEIDKVKEKNINIFKEQRNCITEGLTKGIRDMVKVFIINFYLLHFEDCSLYFSDGGRYHGGFENGKRHGKVHYYKVQFRGKWFGWIDESMMENISSILWMEME